LLRALESVDLSEVTDEASAMERAGHAPKLVMGASTNLKVTYPEDFALARALLLARA
jgi:2-C-methyl-D-erythritol 4-phosphate cytidylyltransferase